MSGRISFTACLMALLLCVGCAKQQPEEPDVPDAPVCDFVLEVSDITSTSCHFSVVPSDKDMTYVTMLVEKDIMDGYENEFKYQDDDLEWFSSKAVEEGKTLQEWLDSFLKRGPFEADEEGLMPDTSYYLYAYGMTSDGYFTTGITKQSFATPEIAKSDVTFDVSVSEVGLTEAKVSVTASDENALFFVNVFSVEQYEEWGGDETAFANHASALVDYYIRMGQTLEAMVLNLGSIGHAEVMFDDLTDDTEYLAYAIGIDDNFFVNSDPRIVEFKTKAAVRSSNTFSVDIEETTFCSAIGTVTPSNSDPFICVIQSKTNLAGYGSDTDIMYDVVTAYEKWDNLDEVLYADEVVDLSAISFLSADTEYEVLCFGWDEAPTTDLTRVPFKTKAAGGRPQAQDFTFVLSDLMHNKVTVEITPKLGLHYFYDCMPKSLFEEYVTSEGTEDEAICRFLDERIDYGADYFGSTRAEYLEEIGAAIGKERWTFTGLEEDAEYMIVAATVDVSTGEIVLRKSFRSEVFRTTILIESDASITFVIDKYYDGTELAELDPEQFARCKGMVMVPYRIVPNADAVHWRTTFTYGEFASWAQRDDILVELDYQCDEDKTQGYAVVHYDQIVSFMGIAVNAEGYTGPFALCEFTAVKGEASPAREFIDSL